MRFTFPTLPNQYLLHGTHYLFPSVPNVHTFSTQTTGTVMQVYFHDGSHLPFSPLMSLARLWNDSQHIPLAAICLSAFTANQTSEQPYSLMSGGLEGAPACLSAPPHPVILLFSFQYSFPSSLPISNQKTFPSLLCFADWLPATDPAFILFYFYLSGLTRFPRSSSVPIPPIFVPVGFAQRYVCLFLRGSEWCVCRPSWQREQQSLTWTYAVRAPIYNYFL